MPANIFISQQVCSLTVHEACFAHSRTHPQSSSVVSEQSYGSMRCSKAAVCRGLNEKAGHKAVSYSKISKITVSLGMTTQSERNVVSAPGQAASKVLLKRWLAAWKEASREGWFHIRTNIESTRVKLLPEVSPLITPFDISTDSYSENLFGRTLLSLSLD